MARLVRCLAILMLAACATVPTAEEIARERAERIAESIEDGRHHFALIQIRNLGRGQNRYQHLAVPIIAEAISGNEEFQAFLEEELSASIESIETPENATAVYRLVSFLSSIDPPKFMETESDLREVMIERNEDGSWPFLLNTHHLPTWLMEAEPRSIIFLRSLENLVESDERQEALLNRVLNNLDDFPVGSREHQVFLSHVDDLGLSVRQIEGFVSTIDASVAERLVERATTSVYLQGNDPLLLDDLRRSLRNADGIRIAQSRRQAEAVVTVDKLRWDEHEPAERTQTVTYATHQVNLAAAILLMPRNATYQYEHMQGRLELEYGIRVTVASSPGWEHLIRGTESRTYSSCANARIRNVFGGVQPASFMANSHMQSLCGAGASRPTMRQLRQSAVRRIGNELERLEPIRANAGS